MSETKKIEQLFENIQKGVKILGVDAMNKSISNILYADYKQDDIIEYIFQCICDEYRISRNTLIRGTGRGEQAEARRIAWCLLYNILNLKLSFISKRIFFYSDHMAVYRAIGRLKRIDTKIKTEREFLEKYEKIKCKIENKIAELQNKKQD
jgi:chromosomal replication initiation ATPase DnaA